jgi:hypothetical protein
MPHTTDKRISKELARLLYLGRLQAKGGRPTLDPTDRGQLTFQALLFECLMSTREHPHPLEQPRKSAMASISGYLNVICHQPGFVRGSEQRLSAVSGSTSRSNGPEMSMRTGNGPGILTAPEPARSEAVIHSRGATRYNRMKYQFRDETSGGSDL